MGVWKLSPRCNFQQLPELTTLFLNVRSLDLKKCRIEESASWNSVVDIPSASMTFFTELNCLSRLANLRALEIGRINDAALKILSKLSLLESLHLGSYLVITAHGVEYLSALQNLKSLRLEGDGMLQSSSYAFLSSLQQLRQLCLHNCKVDDAALEFLSGLNELADLSFFSCRHLRGTGFQFLSHLTNLKSLNVAATCVMEDAFLHLTNCRQFQSLNASFCPFLMPSGIPLILGALPLKKLRLIRCDALTLESVLELKEKLKDCQIIFQKAGDVLLEKIFIL